MSEECVEYTTDDEEKGWTLKDLFEQMSVPALANTERLDEADAARILVLSRQEIHTISTPTQALIYGQLLRLSEAAERTADAMEALADAMTAKDSRPHH